MSQPFSAAAAPVSNGHAQSATPAPYHPALPSFSGFPGLVSLAQSFNAQSPMPLSTPTQQSFFPQLQRPSSSENSDLEKLERLKKEILEGQNPIYKAVPQPNFLESLYLGRSLQAQKSSPAHSDQVSSPPSVSNNPHLTSVESADDDTKTNGQGHTAPSNHVRESSEPKFMPSSSFQAAQNMNGTANLSFLDSTSLKSSQTDQRPPYPNDMSALDPSRLSSSNGTMESTNKGYHDHTGQHAIRPASVNASAHSTPDNSQMPSGPSNKHSSPEDPPYDPKESLRRPGEGALSLDDRNRGSVDSPDLKSYDSRYGHPSQDSERDKHYDYRYDERRIIPNNDHDKQNSPIPGLDTRDLHLQDLTYHDSRYKQNDRMDRSFRPADNHEIRGNHADGSSPLKPADGVEQPSLAGTPPGIFHHQPTREAETNGTPALGERIGGRVPTALEERIGIRIPLGERISTPPSDKLPQTPALTPALQERIGDRAPLEERIGSRPASTDIRTMGDARSIPTPLSLVRARPGEEKYVSSSPASTPASARALQRVEDRPTYSPNDITERPNDRLQSRSSVYGGDARSSVQGSPTVAHNGPRPPLSDSASLHRDKFREASDPRLIPSAAYRDDRDRRYSDAGRSISDVGHYERPILLERDSAASDDRSRPALDTREWHERASYPPKSSSARLEGPLPPHGDRYAQRAWAPNDRGYPGYDERLMDRRQAVPPRTWDRDDLNRARPPPEVYPPPIADARYPPVGYREPSRIHGRSPSPSPLRPAKRVREDVYYDDRDRRYAEPPPSAGSSYYDTHGQYPPRSAHEAYPERGRVSEVAYYDRRPVDMGPPRSPAYTGRAVYSRPDLDKYSAPPPRTA